MHTPIPANSPFHPANAAAYATWRAAKLADYPRDLADLVVEVNDPTALSEAERAALLTRCAKANMALYRLPPAHPADKAAIRALGQQLGLARLDHNLCADPEGITSLQVSSGGRSQEYIPYSNRPINWHTDGYYNLLSQQIYGVILHCVRDALEGGENAYLDHEIAYLLLRDENPDYIEALMQADVMTIPANEENGIELRAAQTGPVFSVHPGTGRLHMRYTARQRNIVWKQQTRVTAALDFLNALFHGDSAYIFRYRMQPNEGVVCNNVLHNRSGFHNQEGGDKQRLLYRARYFDRITTG